MLLQGTAIHQKMITAKDASTTREDMMMKMTIVANVAAQAGAVHHLVDLPHLSGKTKNTSM
jgi:hypothetical protein